MRCVWAEMDGITLKWSFNGTAIQWFHGDFFFLQCRTSTRHGRSTTGNGKTDLKSPW